MTASGSGTRIFTVPPGVPFLRELAAAILAGGFPHEALPEPDPVALMDYRLFLPTRRATRALAQAFVELSPANAQLLPRISPLGDVDEDELLVVGEADAEALESILDLPPAISGVERQLLLTRFILDWERRARTRTEARIHSPAQAAYLAQELAGLIDAVETEQADWSSLEALVSEEFSEHWQDTLDFLDLLRTDLPREMEVRGLINPMHRRNLLLKSQAKMLREEAPAGPVIAAGSTGSIPATAELLQAVAGMDRGAIVLPGLDLHMDTVGWNAVEPNHPQFGMKQLLERLGVTREHVNVLPGVEASEPLARRSRFISEVVRPAVTTDAWVSEVGTQATAEIPKGLDGVAMIVAPAQREEALAIALVMREALEAPDNTVALVTPDRGLARRVASELLRWGVAVDDSAGLPLHAMPQGSLALLVVEAAAASWAPVELLALLKHPLVTLGRERTEVLHNTRLLELAALRGSLSPRGFSSIATALHIAREKAADENAHVHRAVKNLRQDEWQGLSEFLVDVEQLLAPFESALENALSAPPIDAVTAHIQVLEALTALADSDAPVIWNGEGGEALGGLFAAILDCPDLVPRLSRTEYGAFFANLIQGRLVRPRRPAHARAAIWGPLEARLLHADVMILGGLNEGVWPRAASTGAFLNRPMRRDFGLEPPERRTGLAAHDFVQGANAPNVYLSWSEKVDGAPVGPSRWVLRLQTLVGDSEQLLDNRWVSWALGLDEAGPPQPVARPAPRPSVDKRPRSMSVTRVEEWVRDPYATFTRSILKLGAVDPLATEPGAADRGSLIHAIMHLYAGEGPFTPAELALSSLMSIGQAQFAAYLEFPEVAAFWWHRFTRIAEWLVETDGFSTLDLESRLTEVEGHTVLEAPAGSFTLKARADRLDIRSAGWTIYDYKTGAVPSEKQMASGLAPQMPLEAVIALHGGFADKNCSTVEDLVFVRLSGGAVPGEYKGLNRETANDLAEACLDGLLRRIAIFDKQETPYLPRRVPEFERWPGEFDHLSRYLEWSRTQRQDAVS